MILQAYRSFVLDDVHLSVWRKLAGCQVTLYHMWKIMAVRWRCRWQDKHWSHFSERENRRTVSLASVPGKVMEQILLKRDIKAHAGWGGDLRQFLWRTNHASPIQWYFVVEWQHSGQRKANRCHLPGCRCGRPLTWSHITFSSLNQREMDLQSEIFHGQIIGWIVTARILFSAILCPGGGQWQMESSRGPFRDWHPLTSLSMT